MIAISVGYVVAGPIGYGIRQAGFASVVIACYAAAGATWGATLLEPLLLQPLSHVIQPLAHAPPPVRLLLCSLHREWPADRKMEGMVLRPGISRDARVSPDERQKMAILNAEQQ